MLMKAKPVAVRPRLDGPKAQKLRAEARARPAAARREALVLVPLLAVVIVAYHQRASWFPGLHLETQAVSVVALVIIGWRLARDLGRAFGPQLMAKLDPETAGTAGFVIRLASIVATILIALRIAGIAPAQLAIGGAFTAVVFGLAAQQTLGNFFAGTVMLSARPFRIGDRVRFQGGGLAGMIEGTVVALGLLYVELADGANQIMVPNSVALGCAVIPLKEPDAVDFEARLNAGTKLGDVQSLLDDRVEVDTRNRPHIDLQSIDDGELVVRIAATPVDPSDGWLLADQVLNAIDGITRERITAEQAVVQFDANGEPILDPSTR
jgi:small conductance mechanosensitive channel